MQLKMICLLALCYLYFLSSICSNIGDIVVIKNRLEKRWKNRIAVIFCSSLVFFMFFVFMFIFNSITYGFLSMFRMVVSNNLFISFCFLNIILFTVRDNLAKNIGGIF